MVDAVKAMLLLLPACPTAEELNAWREGRYSSAAALLTLGFAIAPDWEVPNNCCRPAHTRMPSVHPVRSGQSDKAPEEFRGPAFRVEEKQAMT